MSYLFPWLLSTPCQSTHLLPTLSLARGVHCPGQPRVRIIHVCVEVEQIVLPQNVSLWHKDYF